MKRAPKKMRERYWLEMLRRHVPGTADAKIVEDERPDFVLSIDGRSIGVEVTEFCRPDPEAQDNLQDRICNYARLAYDSSGGPPVWVSVIFGGTGLRKADVDALARRLADLVTRLVPTECPGSAEESYDWDNRGYFPEVLGRVAVRRLPQLTGSFWAPTSCTFVPAIENADLADIVGRKSAQARQYERSFHEVWLVVGVDNFRVGGTANLSDSAKTGVYQCAFNRVFVVSDNRLVDEVAVDTMQAEPPLADRQPPR